MELRHLRYFIGVAEEENVSRAALKLHLSQPALSRQIRDLEDELGFLLLERSAKSVRLTEAGRAFLTEARAVLQRTEDAVKTARAIARSAARSRIAARLCKPMVWHASRGGASAPSRELSAVRPTRIGPVSAVTAAVRATARESYQGAACSFPAHQPATAGPMSSATRSASTLSAMENAP